MDRRWIGVFAVLGTLVAAWNLALFQVPQWMQAIVVQLGDPVRTVQEPGLYLKLPFIQNVIYFDKRLLDYDASPKELLTKDKQQLVIDNYVRWRIRDPLQYYRTLRSESGAQSRLDDVVYSNLRETLGRHTLRDVVSERRAELMQEVTTKSDAKAREYGIEIVDVRIKRADLPEKNELNVFNRMRTERERLAKKFRAEATRRRARSAPKPTSRCRSCWPTRASRRRSSAARATRSRSRSSPTPTAGTRSSTSSCGRSRRTARPSGTARH